MAWTKADDRKLAEFFRRGPSKNGLSSKSIKPADIHDAINRFFPEYTNRYATFAPLYRRKASAWNLEKELAGSRRGEGKEADDSSEDEDFVGDEEEDIDLDDNFISESELDDERKIPAKKKTPTPKKTPPRRKSVPPPPPSAEDLDDINEGMAGMAVSEAGSRFDFDSKWPLMLLTHLVDKREHVKIHAWVPTLPSNMFRVNIPPGDRKKCYVTTFVPPKFYSERRMDRTNHDDADFNDNTHENTAYKRITEAVKEEFQDDRNPRLVVTGTPQVIHLPFACESELSFDVIYHRIKEMDAVFANDRQYLAVLHINLVSVVKPKEDNTGGHKVIDSDDEEEEDDDDDEMN